MQWITAGHVINEIRETQPNAADDPFVAPSKLRILYPDAGLGLYANRDYEPKEIICIYGGQLKPINDVTIRTHLRSLSLISGFSSGRVALDGIAPMRQFKTHYKDDVGLYLCAKSNTGFRTKSSALKALNDGFHYPSDLRLLANLRRYSEALVNNAKMVFSSETSHYKKKRSGNIKDSKYEVQGTIVPESSVTLLVATKKIQKGQEIINTYNLNLQQFN